MSEKEKETEDDSVPSENEAEINNSESDADAPKTEKSEKSEESADEKIARLEKEIEDLKKDALYKAAENDNWRKRMIQQREDAVSFANESLLSDLLESLDNFDRTIEAAESATDAKSIADGVKMVSKSLVSMLENKYSLSGYGSVGDAFDPDLHEAIGMQEGDVPDEQLAAVYLKGYKLKDKVIRHAKVMVVKPKA